MCGGILGEQVYNFHKVRWISQQMTMILMYVSSQTVPESAIEDDDTKNKK